MQTIVAADIDRNDRVRLPGDNLPYLVDHAWTATDRMVYVQFSSGDQEQFYPDDLFDADPITGTFAQRVEAS